MIDTEAIKQTTSLTDVVAQAGGRLRKVGSELRCACPIHGGHDANAFAVYNGETKWKCFSGDCGSGDVIAFVMAWQGIDFLRAVEYLGGGRQIDLIELAIIAKTRVEAAKRELEDKQREYEEAVRDLMQAKAWERYHDNLQDSHRDFYRQRGIPDSWQDIWKLGYNPHFAAQTEIGKVVSPSLTIPIFDSKWQIKNIRHRLLNPHKPTDKYRPESYGLPTFPFMCDPDLGYEAETIVVWEGEFKAQVLYVTLDDPKIQVLGLPGKNHWRGVLGKVAGKRLFIGFDPGSEKEASDFAKAAGGAGVIALSGKVDDCIVNYGLKKEWAASLLRNARSVK